MVYGDGEQTRTFTYVQDVVQALIDLMNKKEAIGEVFNIGGTEEIRIIDLASKIIDKTGSTSRIELIPYDEVFGKDFEDMRRRVPGTDKINSLTGYKPVTDLDQILEYVITFMEKESH